MGKQRKTWSAEVKEQIVLSVLRGELSTPSERSSATPSSKAAVASCIDKLRTALLASTTREFDIEHVGDPTHAISERQAGGVDLDAPTCWPVGWYDHLCGGPPDLARLRRVEPEFFEHLSDTVQADLISLSTQFLIEKAVADTVAQF